MRLQLQPIILSIVLKVLCSVVHRFMFPLWVPFNNIDSSSDIVEFAICVRIAWMGAKHLVLDP